MNLLMYLSVWNMLVSNVKFPNPSGKETDTELVIVIGPSSVQFIMVIGLSGVQFGL